MNVSSNFSLPFIRRPVATSLITLAILLSGIVAFRFLPVAPLPQVDFPTISVGAGLPGASPETMASAVATPLERSGHSGGHSFGTCAGEARAHRNSGEIHLRKGRNGKKAKGHDAGKKNRQCDQRGR